jgi:beta-galactosidase
MSPPVTGKVPFGGDYNPEQWPEEIWDQDYELFDAARIDTVTLGVFDWALIQPAPDVYDFTLLDRIVRRAAAENRGICLATGTGALPPCLARAHPEVNRTDFEGRRHRYGQRHNACPSSPVFRRLATELARRIARRYADNPAVIAWHVGNEYGGACYCELCAEEFRTWLRRRYTTLAALNAAWYTTFWSHTFTDWNEIEPPNALTEHWRGPEHTAFQGITLDYRRFFTDAPARQLSRREGRDSRVEPRHAGDDQLHGHVPAHRLPPLGAAPGLRVLGQLPAGRHLAGADGTDP